MRKYFVILILVFFVFEVFTAMLAVKSFLYPVKYENLIKTYSRKEGLSPVLVASIINVESSYNKNAKSNAGACGLMQILPSTASYICSLQNYEEIENNDLFTPEINIKFGCCYVKYLKTKFEDFNVVLASYNAGETVVRNWLKNENYSKDGITLDYIPFKETRNYVKKVKSNIKIYKAYKAYKQS